MIQGTGKRVNLREGCRWPEEYSMVIGKRTVNTCPGLSDYTIDHGSA